MKITKSDADAALAASQLSRMVIPIFGAGTFAMVREFGSLPMAVSVSLGVVLFLLLNAMFCSFMVNAPIKNAISSEISLKSFLTITNHRLLVVANFFAIVGTAFIFVVQGKGLLDVPLAVGLGVAAMVGVFVGYRQVTKQWYSKEAIEDTLLKREKTAAAFRLGPGSLLISLVAVFAPTIAWWFGDNVVVSTLATGCSALTAYLFSFVFSRMWVMHQLSPD